MIGSISCQPPDYLTNGWKRLKTSQVFWKLGSNPSTFEEAEAACAGGLILESIFNLVPSSKNEPNHCSSNFFYINWKFEGQGFDSIF